MNDMLDNGWKMTDYSCKECRTNALIDDSKTTFFCCRCNKEILYEDDEEEQTQENQQEMKQDQNMQQNENEDMDDLDYFQKPPVNTRNDANLKAVGDKLLEGWTMLAESCMDCFVPLMKKNGQTMCVGCDKTKLLKQQNQEKAKQETVKPQTQQIPFNQVETKEIKQQAQTTQIKKSPKLQQPPVQKKEIVQDTVEVSDFKGSFNDKMGNMLLQIQSTYQQKMSQMTSVHELDQFVQGPLKNLITLANQLP